MGSSRVHESELHIPERERLQSHEKLDLFVQVRNVGDPLDRNNAKTDLISTADSTTLHAAHNHESSWSCFDAGPIEAGSPLEAHVAARLASSSLYRCSKPILRYASKRNNTDLLTYDMGKTDFDWLMTPPATPLMNSFEDTSSSTGEGSTSGMLLTAREFEDKFLSPKTVASILHDSNKVDRASSTTYQHDVLSQETHGNHHTKPAISLDLPLSTTQGVQNPRTDNHTKSRTRASARLEGEVSLRGTNSCSRTKAPTKGSHQNTHLASSETTRPATSMSRFSAPPPVKTKMNLPSSSHQNTKAGGPSVPITPKMAVTSNSKQNPHGKSASARPTTPTLNQSQPNNTANSVSKPRSTSTGRGTINVSNRNTTKPCKGSRSTSSSRAGSPETKRNIMPSSVLLEMPGFPTEAPPNLRTTLSTRSTSTTRGSRQPTTPTFNTSNSSNAGKDTSRSVSASRRRSSSTLRSSDTRSGSSGSVTATSTTTARGGNSKKGASNSNVLGSKMVDRVVQARHVAASSSSLKSPASSTHTPASSSTLAVVTSKSSSSSSLSVSSPSSARSVISSLFSTSSSMSLSELSNKSLIKSVLPHNAILSTNSPSDLISNGLSQMSEAKPVLGNGETLHPGLNHLQANPSRNENTRKQTTAKNTRALRNFNTMAAILMEKQKQEEQPLPQYISEDSSDFSNELNAIMRQDKAHHYGAFPPKDIIKVSNNWVLNSPDSMRNDSVEFMHLFRQGIDRYGVSESPLVCQHGALSNCKNCSNMGVKGPKGLEEVWKPSPLKGNLNVMQRNSFELWKGSPF